MRKTILWILGLIAVVVVLTKSSDIVALFTTMQQGALIPLILAIIFQCGRYCFQAATYAQSMEAMGEHYTWQHMLPLVISGIFINTLAPSGGTAGAVLIIDDGTKRGIPPARITTGAIVGQMAHYAGFVIIMIVGFTILGATGRLDPVAFICGMVMIMIIGVVVGVLIVCRTNKSLMVKLFKKVERLVATLAVKFHRNPPRPWAIKAVDQVSDAATALVSNPRHIFTILGFATVGYGLELFCFICVGLAFGITSVNEMVAAYVVTNIFTVISPVPNGVGIAEATATLILTSYGSPVSVSTAVALVFRGFVFWIPFAVGAVLLRRTGFFTSKKVQTPSDKAKQTGYISAVFVCFFGVINTLFALMPVVPDNYAILREWLSAGTVFTPTIALLLGILLIMLTPGIWKRSRVTWAWTLSLLAFLAAAQLVSAKSYFVVVPILALGTWLFIKRSDFDQIRIHSGKRQTIFPILGAILITLAYTVSGFMLLGGDYFGFTKLPGDALKATLEMFAPGLFISALGYPVPTADYGEWFMDSVYYVTVFTLLWAFSTIIFPWLRRRRYLKTGQIEQTPTGYVFTQSGKFTKIDTDAPTEENLRKIFDREDENTQLDDPARFEQILALMDQIAPEGSVKPDDIDKAVASVTDAGEADEKPSGESDAASEEKR